MITIHDEKMKSFLFYAVMSFFIIITTLTILSIFFGLGKITETERSLLFGSFILEIGTISAALAYSMFKLKNNEKFPDNNPKIFETLEKLSDKVDVLAHDIEFACKLLNVQRYGGLKFPASDFRKLWKHFAYQPEAEFLVLSYIPAKEWTEEYSQKIIIPTKSRIETDKIRAHRIFAIDNKEELAILQSTIELHRTHGIPVSYVYTSRLVEVGICKKSLDHSFMLIDNNTLVLFHLENRTMTDFEVISISQEISSFRQKFQAIEALATTA